MTGWRCAAIVGNAEAIAQYWRLKSNIDSGLFEAVQLAGAAALAPEVDPYVAEMNAIYTRRRDLVCDALAQAGVHVTRPQGTIYVWAPIPDGYANAAAYCEHVLEAAAVVISPGGAYGPHGEGFFRISLTCPTTGCWRPWSASAGWGSDDDARAARRQSPDPPRLSAAAAARGRHLGS